MNRKELKEQAKELIRGNKWYLWKPAVFFAIALFIVTFVISLILTIFQMDQSTITTILSPVTSIAECLFALGYAKYLLDFVRGKKDVDWKDTIKFGAKHWIVAIVVSILVGIIIAIGSILLVIPGIIAAIGLMFYLFVSADNPELGIIEIIKKSWEMTKGHKMELFVLMLSFIGWCILAGFTFGILYIWLYPYMEITSVLAYEKLKGNE